VSAPLHAAEHFHVEDPIAKMAVDVAVSGAENVAAELWNGHVVFPNAVAGGHWVHAASTEGLQDYLSFDADPGVSSIAYTVAMSNVAALRLFGNVLEFLDKDGAPRLRIPSPYIAGRDRKPRVAELSVQGCAVDTSPLPPWGRVMAPPGATTCTVNVGWNRAGIEYPAVLDPSWTTTGSMSIARSLPGGTSLADGRVLVAGGHNPNIGQMDTAEVYDPATGTWALTGSMSHWRANFGMATLADGTALAIGNTTFGPACEKYDPATGLWTATGTMTVSRFGEGVVTLNDGRVLVAGGDWYDPINNVEAGYLKTAEIYDNGIWTPVADMSDSRMYPTMTLLQDGRVLVTGLAYGSWRGGASAEVFDPVAGTWTPTGAMTLPDRYHAASVLLPDGRVVVAGGSTWMWGDAVGTAEIYDPSTNNWTDLGNVLSVPRYGLKGVASNGSAYFVGGQTGSTWNPEGPATAAIDVFNGTYWAATGASSMSTPRAWFTLAAIPNGILAAGGDATTVYLDPLATSEVLSTTPACASASECASGFCVNGNCCNTACTDECSTCYFDGICAPKVSGSSCGDDANPCTADRCDGTSTLCQHPVGNAGVACRTAVDACDAVETCTGTDTTCPADGRVTDGSSCDDGNACTHTDTCQAGACTGGNPATCTPVDDCHEAGTCDAASGTCSTPAKADGAACTLNGATAVCRAGTCVAPSSGVGCTQDIECGQGYACGSNNGDRFGASISGNFCWRSYCDARADFDCGTIASACGLCPAPSLVGALPATLTVSNEGKAQYSVPLDLPVGINGLAPNLTLAYMGTRGNGVLGAGWAIGGLSSISRCPKTTGQDAAAGPIEDNENDRFCWDGKRLVAVAGTYGQDGTEYRTEFESFARIISHGDPGAGALYHGPTTFEVRTPDGRILTFGGESAFEANLNAYRVWGLSSISDRSGNNISMSYLYQDCSSGHCRQTPLMPNEIHYADRIIRFEYGSRGDTRSYYQRGSARDFKTRLSRIQVLVAGTPVWSYRMEYEEFRNLSHLSKLWQCAQDSTTNCKPATQFTYDFAGGFLEERGSAEVDLDFGNGVRSYQSGKTIVFDVNGDGRDDVLFPDRDGGVNFEYHLLLGRDSSTGGSTFPTSINTGIYAGSYAANSPPGPCFSQDSVVDLNHDGKDDLMSHCKVDGHWRVYLSTGTNLNPLELSVVPPGIGDRSRIYSADLDGDGWQDILSCQEDTPYPNSNLIFYRNLGGPGQFAPPTTMPPLGNGCYLPLQFIDVDGDGVVNVLRPERSVSIDRELNIDPPAVVPWKALVIAGLSGQWIDTGITTDGTLKDPPPNDPASDFTWAGIGAGSGGEILLAPLAPLWQVKPIDYNGDGLMDLLQYQHFDSRDQRVELYVNTGHGFVKSTSTIKINESFDDNYSFARAQVIDWNQDGRGDLLMPLGDYRLGEEQGHLQWSVYISADDGGPFLIRPVDFEWGQLDEFNVPVLADLDGDGDKEVLIADYSHHLTVNEAASERNHLLTEVVDGLHRRHTIEYGRGGFDVYSRTEPCAATVQCPRRFGPLVKSTTEWLWSAEGAADPYARLRSKNYSYVNAASGLYGRGGLGFGWIVTSEVDGAGQDVWGQSAYFDNTTLNSTVAGSNAKNWYPFAGMPYRMITTDRQSRSLGGVVTARSTEVDSSDRVVRISADGRPFVHQLTTATRVRDRNLTASNTTTRLETITTAQVDDYGNVTYKAVTSRNGAGEVLETRTAETTYNVTSARRADWLIRLPDAVEVTSMTDEGMVTRQSTFSYYPNGQLHTIAREPNWAASKLETSFAYDSFGNTIMKSETGASGSRGETIAYEPSGLRMIERSLGGGLTWQYAMDAARTVALRVTDPNGLESGTSIDIFGRITGVRAPSKATVVEYNGPDFALGGSLSVEKRTLGGELLTTIYDSSGRATATINKGYLGDDVIQERQYDWADRVISEARPHLTGDTSQGVATIAYDGLGRVASTTIPEDGAPNGKKTILYGYEAAASSSLTGGWDAYARKYAIDVIQRNDGGIVSSQGVGANGKILVTQDAAGGLTHHRYGAFDKPSRIRDAMNNETVFEYDVRGNRTKLIDPDRGEEDVVYDAFGQARTITDSSGQKILNYDDVGRLTDRSLAGGPRNVWRYDGTGPGQIGKLVEARSEDATGAVFVRTTYGYVTSGNGLGQLASVQREIGGQTFVTNMSYTPAGQLEYLDYPSTSGGDFSLYHHYDAYGHLDYVYDPLSTVFYWSMATADQGYRIGLEDFGNGVRSQRTYQPLSGRLEHINTYLEADGLSYPVQDLSYVYDQHGNVWERNDALVPENSRGYAYDALDRLNVVLNGTIEAERYEYDAIGNMTFRAGVGDYLYQSSKPHAVTSAGGNSYQYDGQGNQIVRTGPSVKGGEQTIDYTPFGMPSVVRGPGGVVTAQFTYDANDHRVRFQSDDGADVFDIGDFYQERRQGNEITHRYRVWAGGREVAQVTRVEQNGVLGGQVTKYLHGDGIGSTDTITDAAAVVERIRYDSYGAVTQGSLSGAAVTSGFTGQRHDESLDLIDMKGRLYDPKLGRFISADPFVPQPHSSQSFNRYSYVLNNPFRYTDPSGFGPEGEPEMDCHEGEMCGLPRETDAEIPSATGQPGEAAVDAVEQPSVESASVSAAGFGTGVLNGDQPASVGEALFNAAGGAAFGSLLGAGTGYALGGVTALCPLCGLALGVGFAAYGAYGLATGGAEALWQAGSRIALGRGTSSDYFALGSLVGGLAGSPSGVAGFRSTAAQGSVQLGGEPGLLMTMMPRVSEAVDSVAATESEFVNLASPSRTQHILFGDETGGGHMWPGGGPGKTQFPLKWSGDQIMHHVSDIATDSALSWEQETGVGGSLFTRAGNPARFSVIGERGGIQIKVILEPAGEGIITSYPVP
jgi:RHS repeat-associated protein